MSVFYHFFIVNESVPGCTRQIDGYLEVKEPIRFSSKADYSALKGLILSSGMHDPLDEHKWALKSLTRL
jgi:hypothetical protein